MPGRDSARGVEDDVGRCVRVFVSGRVQGVWFRESTRRRAIELGVTGWVRNLYDGRVEVLLAGDSIAVASAIEFVSTGPPHARVDAVELEEKSLGESPVGFHVR